MSKGNPLFSIARVDQRNQRVFVVLDTNYLADLRKITTIVKHIDSNYKFKDNLNVSFFSNAKYVGYKDEFGSQTSTPDTNFFRNYVGEYSKKSKEFWTYPSSPIQKVKYRIE